MKITISLLSDRTEVTVSPAHRAFSHGRTRPPAGRSGTSEADPAEPDCAPAGLPRSRHRPHAGQLPGQAQDLIKGYWRSVSGRGQRLQATHIRSAGSYAEISDQLGAPFGSIGPTPGRAWLSCASSCRNMSRASRRLLTGHPRSRDSRKTQYHGHPLGALVYESSRAHPGHGTLDQQPWARKASNQQH